MFKKGSPVFQKLINKLNDLRPRQLIMLAVVAAILMFLTVYFGMSLLTPKAPVVVQPTQTEEKAPPPVEKVAVVVAKTNIPPRTRIQETMLQMKELPVELVPEGAIKSFDDVLNVQVKVSIFSGDILTIQKVFTDKSAEGFIGTIPPDCRAVSLNVNEITSVAGFAKPGDFVDLLLSERSDYSATTSILLQNVPLLSINQDMGDSMIDSGSGSAISNPTIATFALHPEDALKLIAASKLGEIYMSLRPANPQSNYVGAVEYTIESVNAPKVEPVQAVPAIPENSAIPLPQLPAVSAEPPVPKIEIIQGDEIVQNTHEAPVVESSPSGTNPPLPAIPSRAANPPVTNSTPTRSQFTNSPASRALDSLPLGNSRPITGKK